MDSHFQPLVSESPSHILTGRQTSRTVLNRFFSTILIYKTDSICIVDAGISIYTETVITECSIKIKITRCIPITIDILRFRNTSSGKRIIFSTTTHGILSRPEIPSKSIRTLMFLYELIIIGSYLMGKRRFQFSITKTNIQRIGII